MSKESDDPVRGKLSLGDIVAPRGFVVGNDIETSADPQTAAGMNALARDLAKTRYVIQTEGIKQDIDARRLYGKLVFVLLCCWLCCLFMLLAGVGIGLLKLSDSVLIALITGTTANILGIFAIVILYLFPKDRQGG